MRKGEKKVYTINNSHMKDENIVTWTKITAVIAVPYMMSYSY